MENRRQYGWTWFWRTIIALQAAMFVALFILSGIHWSDMPAASQVNTAMNVLGLFLLALISMSIVRGGMKSRQSVRFEMLIAQCAAYMLSDGLFWIFDGVPETYLLNVACNMVYCLCPIGMMVVFWYLLDIWLERDDAFARVGRRAVVAAALVGALLILLNTFTGFYYTVSPETGRYARGPLYGWMLAVPAAMLVLTVIRVLRDTLPAMDRAILLAYPVFPYAVMLLRTRISDSSLQVIAAFCAIVFIYTNFYVSLERDAISRERALTESRLRALQMQINPHFFFNALTSVASLCDSEPQAAQEMVYRLSDYLHDNFSDINRPSVIPFRQEIEHVEHYLSIEAVRFPSIHVEYDLRAVGFSIPAVTLQPLVENAIRHGICKRRGSAGNIRIVSRETEDSWLVRVEDDGVGFEALPDPSDGGHVGIGNVRTRLELLCGGMLEVTGEPGKGAVSEIVIPKKVGGGVRHVRHMCRR